MTNQYARAAMTPASLDKRAAARPARLWALTARGTDG
jgi:hypothetical protein